MTLDQLSLGEECQILSLDTEEKLTARLSSLNLTAGAKVKKVGRSFFRKNGLYDCSGIRVGLGNATAQKIEVKKL